MGKIEKKTKLNFQLTQCVNQLNGETVENSVCVHCTVVETKDSEYIAGHREKCNKSEQFIRTKERNNI